MSYLDATVDGLELFELLESNKKFGDLSGLIGGGLEHWCLKLFVFNFALDILDWKFILSAAIEGTVNSLDLLVLFTHN